METAGRHAVAKLGDGGTQFEVMSRATWSACATNRRATKATKRFKKRRSDHSPGYPL